MQTITAIFDSIAAAQAAREALVREGLDGDGIALSACQTSDDVAAEAPGQSFENQPGQDPRDSASARYGTAVRSGACTLTLDAAATEVRRLREWLTERGARQVLSPPG